MPVSPTGDGSLVVPGEGSPAAPEGDARASSIPSGDASPADASLGLTSVAWPEPEAIRHYVDILASRGIEWGLLGPREVDKLWTRHILNSVAVAELVPHGATVVDVGSGAGLPGIPLALARPDLRVTLLEPLLRRANFLTLAVDELGLGDRVEVVRSRAEDHKGSYAVVTCRAVAPLPRLLTWCLPLVAPRGKLVALKGASAASEVEGAADDLRMTRTRARVEELLVAGASDPTWAIVVERR